MLHCWPQRHTGSPRTDVGVWVQVLPQPRLAALQRTVYLDGVVLSGCRGETHNNRVRSEQEGRRIACQYKLHLQALQAGGQAGPTSNLR